MGQPTWHWLVIVYLFLGGLGAGAFLVAAVFELSGRHDREKFCPTTLTGATISGPAVALGSALLILDLGDGKVQPWRMVYLFTNFGSVMTWGIWILCLFIPIALLYGLLHVMEVEPFLKGFVWARLPRLVDNSRLYRRRLAVVGSAFAVCTALYTGVLISAVGPAIPLWSQPLLPFLRIPLVPVLFLVSAVSTGLGLTFDLATTLATPHAHHEIRNMPLVHVILIGLENVLIGMLLISALHSGGAAAESARLVMTGPLSAIFWSGVVVVGLIYPIVVHMYASGARHHSLFSGIGSGVAIVLAGLFLRYLIVTAGIPASL